MIKRTLKIIITILARIVLLPLFLLYKLQTLLIKSEQPFCTMAQFLSLIPGIWGNYLRREFYRFSLEKCSSNCCISFGALITHPTAEIGEKVYIGANSSIGTVTIGSNVLIGSNVDILSGKRQHDFSSTDKPIALQQRSFDRVYIGNGSWLGNSSVIMANVGEECVIGAGSVVVEDIDAFSIAVGNPARVVKKRR